MVRVDGIGQRALVCAALAMWAGAGALAANVASGAAFGAASGAAAGAASSAVPSAPHRATAANRAPSEVDHARAFAPPLARGMVLQRNDMAALRGFAFPGDRVQITASWRDAALEGIAGDDGRWAVRLPTPDAGGPHVIEARITGADGAGAEVLRLADVYIGEVWVAGGQSNMEMQVAPASVIGEGYGGVRGWPDMLERPADPMLRVFDVPRSMADAPPFGPPAWSGEWIGASPDTVGRMSAVAYAFGYALRRELNVPVGIITSTWGGTRIEAWMSDAALAAHGGSSMDELAAVRGRAAAAIAADGRGASTTSAAGNEPDALSPMDAADPGIVGGWAMPDFNDADWPALDVPGNWAAAPLDAHDGLVWVRRAIDVPADQPGLGGPWRLDLGAIDDRDDTWINGVFVGRTGGVNQWNQPRRYAVPAGIVVAGRNVIAVRVRDTGGLGGMTGPADAMQLVSQIEAEVGDLPASIDLAGTWRARPTLNEAAIGAATGVAPRRRARYNEPTVLGNAMIAPIAPTAVRGFLWYQGESNVGRAAEYTTLMPALVEDWRSRFGRPNAPFLFVQIAPFNYGASAEAAAWLRDAQRRAAGHAGTGMVVTSDVGTPFDIHPMDKTTVADRLVGLALKLAYGRGQAPASSPLLAGFQREGDAIRVRFAAESAAIAVRGEGPLTHFEILDASGVWHAAEAAIDGALTVVVRADGVTDPQAVRFGWASLTPPNLVGPTGLPASPFTTQAMP
ncbi:MAG: sialate O-acetylesterase [Phycisphaerales bacterium]